MNINEIRVGNYLLRQGKIVEITKICRYGIIYIDNNPCPFHISNFEPLELRDDIQNILTTKVINAYNQFSTQIMIAHFHNEHLHTLQNIYADIIGTEIEIDFEMFYDIVESIE